MFIALTGTPGTGKTEVTHYLQQHDLTILSLNEVAIKHQFITGVDPKRGSYILDIKKINAYITQSFQKKKRYVVIEGHAAHLLESVSWVIVLRCHPSVLFKRLLSRGWNIQKIHENVEAEILDIIICEASEIHKTSHIFEIDTTNRSCGQTAEIILNFINKNFAKSSEFRIGLIDWTEEILKDHE